MEKKQKTFFGLIATIFGIFLAASNPWDFMGWPTPQFAVGFIILILGIYAVYDANT